MRMRHSAPVARNVVVRLGRPTHIFHVDDNNDDDDDHDDGPVVPLAISDLFDVHLNSTVYIVI